MCVRAQHTGTGLIWGERRYKQEATLLPALLLLHPLLGRCLFQKERLEPPRASHELQARRNEAPRATGMWCRVCGARGSSFGVRQPRGLQRAQWLELLETRSSMPLMGGIWEPSGARASHSDPCILIFNYYLFCCISAPVGGGPAGGERPPAPCPARGSRGRNGAKS